MAVTNHERIGKALELLRAGLAPFVEREFLAQHGRYWTMGWSRWSGASSRSVSLPVASAKTKRLADPASSLPGRT